MNLFDQHLHSKLSFDSRAEPADNVRRAIEVGLAGLTFTEHYDSHPDEWEECVYDHARFTETIEQLRQQFNRSIHIGKGVEVDYQPDNMPALIDFVDRGNFEVVLLSVHWSQGAPIHRKNIWEGKDPSTVTRQYLNSVLQAVRHCQRLHRNRSRVFDILSHLDFCKRYSNRFAGTVHIAEHIDVIDEILRACLAADIVPEINTSTLRGDLAETMPGPIVVQRYAELGGTMMALGSDSHRAADIGAGFDHALNMLRQAGITNVAVFERRTRRTETIS
ncbi:MAG: histidinol-phosphatase HisJ family protein [Phycisphaerae bacterium]